MQKAVVESRRHDPPLSGSKSLHFPGSVFAEVVEARILIVRGTSSRTILARGVRVIGASAVTFEEMIQVSLQHPQHEHEAASEWQTSSLLLV